MFRLNLHLQTKGSEVIPIEGDVGSSSEAGAELKSSGSSAGESSPKKEVGEGRAMRLRRYLLQPESDVSTGGNVGWNVF